MLVLISQEDKYIFASLDHNRNTLEVEENIRCKSVFFDYSQKMTSDSLPYIVCDGNSGQRWKVWTKLQFFKSQGESHNICFFHFTDLLSAVWNQGTPHCRLFWSFPAKLVLPRSLASALSLYFNIVLLELCSCSLLVSPVRVMHDCLFE